MIQRAVKAIKLLSIAMLGTVLGAGACSADVINVDTTRLTPEVADACRQAEAIWEARIQAYSTELPKAVRDQLRSLQITCEVIDIADGGVGEVLAQAGPDSLITFSQNTLTETKDFSVALETTLSFDVDDVPILLFEGTLVRLLCTRWGIASVWVHFGRATDTSTKSVAASG